MESKVWISQLTLASKQIFAKTTKLITEIVSRQVSVSNSMCQTLGQLYLTKNNESNCLQSTISVSTMKHTKMSGLGNGVKLDRCATGSIRSWIQGVSLALRVWWPICTVPQSLRYEGQNHNQQYELFLASEVHQITSVCQRTTPNFSSSKEMIQCYIFSSSTSY